MALLVRHKGLAWSPDQSEIWFSAVKSGIYRSLYATYCAAGSGLC